MLRRQRTSLLSCLLTAWLAIIGTTSSQAAATYGNTLKIGALLSLTGNWSSLGTMSQTLLEMAEDDVNAYLKAHGSSKRVDVLVRDTQLDPDLALEKFKELIDRRVVAVVGPQSSSEVAKLRYVANAKKIPMISQGSTASSLAFPDEVFRLVPDDTHESEAMAALLTSRTVEVVIPVWRNDAGNNGLHDSLKERFETAGGTMTAGIRYEPDTQDFAPIAAEVQTQVNTALQSHAAASVAVYVAGFDEVVALFNAADSLAGLKSVKWYGSDGVALSAALLADTTAAEFAMAVDYPNPLPGLPKSAQEKWQALSDRAFASTGLRPDAFALAAYDALWIAALDAAYSGHPVFAHHHGTTHQEALPQTANLYFGATGWTALNEAGDRKHGDYDFWALRRNQGGDVQWVSVCRYDTTSGLGGTLSCPD